MAQSLVMHGHFIIPATVNTFAELLTFFESRTDFPSEGVPLTLQEGADGLELHIVIPGYAFKLICAFSDFLRDNDIKARRSGDDIPLT